MTATLAVAMATGAATATAARAQPAEDAHASANSEDESAVGGGDRAGAPIDDSPALPADSAQAFVADFVRGLTVDPTETVLDFVDPTLIDDFLRANGTVVNPANRRIVMRNLVAGARSLMSVQRFAVAPDLVGTTDDGHAVVRVELRSAITVTADDVERRKRAAADPELLWAMGPELADQVAGLSAEERDAFFDSQLGTTVESAAPFFFVVASAPDAGFRIYDAVFGRLDEAGVSLRGLPELVARARGGDTEIQRKRSLASVQAIMFAVGALIVLLSLRRYRQQQAEKRRENRRQRRLRRRRQREKDKS